MASVQNGQNDKKFYFQNYLEVEAIKFSWDFIYRNLILKIYWKYKYKCYLFLKYIYAIYFKWQL